MDFRRGRVDAQSGQAGVAVSQAEIFDDVVCSLGEGPLWHPTRRQLFWFDINGHRLHTRTPGLRKTWDFGQYVSAAGWVDDYTLLIASETALLRFDIDTGDRETVCTMEADNPVTRCNDGRADPYGGFWIGTMGKNKEMGAGAVYRYYRGELRRLYAPWTIPNAMCFSPDGSTAYLADTEINKLWRIRLDGQGWPCEEPELLLDPDPARYRPDGAVVDAMGDLWIAHYGHAKITRHAPDGLEKAAYAIPGKNVTCPAFGGADLTTLYVTTAAQNLPEDAAQGRTYRLAPGVAGQAEHRVIL